MSLVAKIFLFLAAAAVVLVAWQVSISAPSFKGSESLLPPDMRTQGEVSAVGAGSVTVELLNYSSGEGVGVGSRTFSVTADTRIWRQVLPPVPPALFGVEDIPLAELQAGSRVTITPSPLSPLVATDILVTALPSLPPTAPQDI